MKTRKPAKQWLLPSLVALGLMGAVASGGQAIDRGPVNFTFSRANSADSEVLDPSGIAQSPLLPTPNEINPTLPSASMPSAAVDSRLVEANTAFGLQLFSQVLAADEPTNVMISPLSVAMALSMVYNGASGETQQAMAQALNWRDLSLDDVNRSNAALMQSLLAADPTVQFTIANSLWGREGFPFESGFLQQNQEFYQAEITSLNFASPEALSQINGWVNQATQGKIPTIVNQINPNDVLFLLNAVYFKGNWQVPFDPSATVDRPFTPSSGTPQTVPMMSRSGSYRYLETEQFQAVSLPYGNGRLSLEVFLPKPEFSLSDLQPSLTPQQWNQWQNQFASRAGSLQLPRFKFEYATSLNDALAAIGMDKAFSAEDADFSKLSSVPTFISRVDHKTFIEVNESGTEAAAATSVVMAARAAAPDPRPPFQMVVDRPFLAVIRDRDTGTLLFLGAIEQP